jgi:hypothetical protein
MDYKCEDCDKIYKTKDSLRQHIKLKHSKVQSLQCDKCDKICLNEYSLKDHLYHIHPSKLQSCSFCGSRFKASRNYIWILSIIGFIMEYFETFL